MTKYEVRLALLDGFEITRKHVTISSIRAGGLSSANMWQVYSQDSDTKDESEIFPDEKLRNAVDLFFKLKAKYERSGD